MHFLTLLLPTLALSTTTASAEETICQYALGPTWLDACCDFLLSRTHGPCPTPVYVANATLCTAQAYPEGWVVCIDKVC
jgi:hypothetical protein